MQDLPEHLWHKSFRYYVKEDPDRKGGPNLRMIRLDPERPSLTVTAYIYNKFVHPCENRFVTVREAARLQGFPDTLRFAGTLTSTQMQVGNAVPIPLAKAVFEQIAKQAEGWGFSRQLKAMSLFSGAGGMDIGAEQTGRVDTRIAIEYWKDACATLQGYYQGRAHVLCQSVCEIENPLTLWNNTTQKIGSPDIVYGGPPCQAFSQAGKQKGFEDDRGVMLFEFLRFVGSLLPPFFVMENVANLRGVQGGQLYRHILKQMDALGYHVTVGPLLAADYGAAQRRQRLLFLGCKKDIGAFDLPTHTHSPTPGLFGPEPYATVGEVFAGLPQAVFSGV